MANDRVKIINSIGKWANENKKNKRSMLCVLSEHEEGKVHGSLIFAGDPVDIGNGIVNLLAQYPQLENVIRDALQEYRHWVITKSASQN